MSNHNLNYLPQVFAPQRCILCFEIRGLNLRFIEGRGGASDGLQGWGGGHSGAPEEKWEELEDIVLRPGAGRGGQAWPALRLLFSFVCCKILPFHISFSRTGKEGTE